MNVRSSCLCNGLNSFILSNTNLVWLKWVTGKGFLCCCVNQFLQMMGLPDTSSCPPCHQITSPYKLLSNGQTKKKGNVPFVWCWTSLWASRSWQTLNLDIASPEQNPLICLCTCAHLIPAHVPNRLAIYIFGQVQRSLPPVLLILIFVTYRFVSCVLLYVSTYILEGKFFGDSLKKCLFIYSFTLHSIRHFCLSSLFWVLSRWDSNVPKLKKFTASWGDEHIRKGDPVWREPW